MYHMTKASVRDLRYDFKKIERLLLKGEEIQITKRRRVIARLVPDRHRDAELKWTDGRRPGNSSAHRRAQVGKSHRLAASPHVAGISVEGSIDNRTKQAQEVVRVISGQPPLNQVCRDCRLNRVILGQITHQDIRIDPDHRRL